MRETAEALLSLLNEHEKVNVVMRFSKANKGRANIIKQSFSIPHHALGKGEAYLLYYVAHEFAHCSNRDATHGTSFKRYERKLLSLLGITITYKKAYPKYLYANGEMQYRARGY
jgi:hypothetical protein